ncbi:hypothetical protein OKT23_17230 [Providencia rettgeri]|uniref:hypothetical protein n=1 Tax=Providencia TaxID=586 RepID=UPI00226F5CD0|nr:MULTISPECIES: hypothetical protein [Providencia]MCX9097008.1 hypothetical protein [Providencia rettgeri]MCX9126487.1 hypothetical protein [Providencia rettgeri]MCX9129859.1 hypothetical protein [Providencia rettgeri]HEM6846614.1 hypothetical protein [Providencia rettgeri]
MNKFKIIIFHPSSYFGGASVLFSRIYNHAMVNNINLIYIDEEDGYTKSRNMNSKNIYTLSQNLNNLITNDDIIICTTTQINMMKKYLSNITKNPKVILWVVHPYEASIYFFKGIHKAFKSPLKYVMSKFLVNLQYRKKNKLVKFINAQSGNSLFFMDASCINATNYFLNTKIATASENIIPIPYKSDFQPLKKNKNIEKNIINIAYFGRVEDFKTAPIISLLQELSELRIKEKIVFHIIGGGRSLPHIMNKFDKKLTIVSLGMMENQKAKIYINDQVDILFAMGTAAIDGASIGTATVMLNASNSIKKQQYDWLYLSNGFSLGDYIDSPWFISPSKTLYDIIQDWKINHELISAYGEQYVIKNHDIDAVMKKLISKAEKVNLRLDDLINNHIFY